MNWVEKKKKEENENKIIEYMKNIEKNSIELSKYLYEETKKGNCDIYKEYMTKQKYEELINNYKFIQKYNVSDIKLTLLRILVKKDKDINITKEKMLDYIEKAKELKVDEFKKYIFKGVNEKITKKTFVLDEEKIELFEEVKEKIKKEYPDVKLTNEVILENLMISYLYN